VSLFASAAVRVRTRYYDGYPPNGEFGLRACNKTLTGTDRCSSGPTRIVQFERVFGKLLNTGRPGVIFRQGVSDCHEIGSGMRDAVRTWKNQFPRRMSPDFGRTLLQRKGAEGPEKHHISAPAPLPRVKSWASSGPHWTPDTTSIPDARDCLPQRNRFPRGTARRPRQKYEAEKRPEIRVRYSFVATTGRVVVRASSTSRGEGTSAGS